MVSKKKIIILVALIAMLFALLFRVSSRNSLLTTAATQSQANKTEQVDQRQDTEDIAYSVTFDYEDLYQIYKGEVVQRDGLTISGTSIVEQTYYSAILDQTFNFTAPTTINVTYDASWDELTWIGFESFMPKDFVNARMIVNHIIESGIDLSATSNNYFNSYYDELEKSTSFVTPILTLPGSFYVNENDFIKQIGAANYELVNFAPSQMLIGFPLKLSSFANLFNFSFNDQTVMLKNLVKSSITNINVNYSRNTYSISTTWNDRVAGQLIGDYTYLFSLTIVGNRDNKESKLVSSKLIDSALFESNQIPLISRDASFNSLETKFSYFTNDQYELNILTTEGENLPDGLNIYSGAFYGGVLDDQVVDYNFVISNSKGYSFTIPWAVKTSDFERGDPNCCQPSGGEINAGADFITSEVQKAYDAAGHVRPDYYVIWDVATWAGTMKALGLPSDNNPTNPEGGRYASANQNNGSRIDPTLPSGISTRDTNCNDRGYTRWSCNPANWWPTLHDDTNNNSLYNCYKDACRMQMPQTDYQETAVVQVWYPQVDNSNEGFFVPVRYYDFVDEIQISINTGAPLNAVNNEILAEVDFADDSATAAAGAIGSGYGLTVGSTYQEIANIIWSFSAAVFGLDSNEVNQLNLKFWQDAGKTQEIPSAQPLNYGATSNHFYYSFEIIPGAPDYKYNIVGNTFESPTFIIPDTRIKRISPDANQDAAGIACVTNLAESKLTSSIWNATTYWQTVFTDIDTNCSDEFGVTQTTADGVSISESTDLHMYWDTAGTQPVDLGTTIGDVTQSQAKYIYYRYERNSSLPWHYEYIMSMHNISYYTKWEVYVGDAAAMPVVNTINQNVKAKSDQAIAAQQTPITYSVYATEVNNNLSKFVSKPGVMSVQPIFYVDGVQTDLSSSSELWYDIIPEGTTLAFELTATPATTDTRYVFSSSLSKDATKLFLDWDSTIRINAQTAITSPMIEDYFKQTDAVWPTYDESGELDYVDPILVASNSQNEGNFTYQYVYDQITSEFYNQLFTGLHDQLYVDQDSLVLYDNGMKIDLEDAGAWKLQLGSHEITYEYKDNGNRCPYYTNYADPTAVSSCRPVDGFAMSGFDDDPAVPGTPEIPDGSNHFNITIYHVALTDQIAKSTVEQEISLQLITMLDIDNDGYIDTDTTVTYAEVYTLVNDTLRASGLFKDPDDWDDVDIRVFAIYVNPIDGKSLQVEFDSTTTEEVSSDVTGIRYKIEQSTSSPWFLLDNASMFEYSLLWHNDDYKAPVGPGEIKGDGLKIYLILGAFLLLIILGIVAGWIVSHKRKQVSNERTKVKVTKRVVN